MPAVLKQKPEYSPSLREFADTLVWLLSEDTETSAFAKNYLQTGGFTNFSLFESCKSCFQFQDCDACFQSFKGQVHPELIVLDIDQSNDTGFRILKQMRRELRQKKVPIIVLTDSDQGATRNEAFRLGATNVLVKPLDEGAFVSQACNLVKAYRLTRELEEYKARMSQELRIAKRLQQSLQPEDQEIEKCQEKTGLDISFALHSSSELSGDFWGIKHVTENSLTFFIADLTGHGVAAAANTFRMHEILSNEELGDGDLIDFVSRVNKRFYRRTPPDVFASLLVGSIDLEKHTFSYVSAMAPCPLLWRTGAELPFMLYSAGVPMGVTEHPGHELHTVPYGPGDRLFFYSDALVEAPSKNGGTLGVMMPCDIMATAIRQDKRSIIGSIEEQFCEETIGPLADDLTLLLISAPEDE